MGEQWPIHTGRPGGLTNSCKCVTVSHQTAAVKGNPLTGIWARFFREPPKFFVALVHRSDCCNAILRCRLIFRL